MLRRVKKSGLRLTLFLNFTGALVAIMAVLYVAMSWRLSSYLESRLKEHGRAKIQEVTDILSWPDQEKVQNKDMRAMRLMGGLLGADKDFTYAAIVSDGDIMLESGPQPTTSSSWKDQLVRAEGEGSLELPNGDWLFSGLIPDGACNANFPRCRLVLVVSFEPLRSMLGELRVVLVTVFSIGLVLVVALVFYVTHRRILQPLDRMMAVARKMAEGDLTSRVALDTGGELGALAEALDGIGQSLRKTLGQVRGVSEVVSNVIEQLSRAGTTVSSGAATIQGRVTETSSSMEEMLASLRGIAENVEVLYQSAEESSSSIMEMAATNDEVAENVQAMAGSVEETTSAIEEMTFSIKEVAKNIDELRDSTEETSTSIGQMDNAIGQVEANANETARLSEQVSEDAKTGVEALRKTMQGMDRIKENSRAAAGVIDSLGKRISEIGNILNVIDDVAEQTNLLALNAAIIAAQSGEHGKGFAVVADEIKDLADRTGKSTKEIADLISGVQEESRNAVQVMNQGVRNVEEGVQLGREAEGTLRKINDSAQKSTQMVKAIASATVEQARGSRQVTQAIQRISETVLMISKASNEQAKGGEQIMNSAERMKAITAHVQRSSQEQAHGSKQITRSIENINEMVTHLNRAQKEQTKGSEQVLKAVEAIQGVSDHQTRSVKALEEAIDSLQRQSEVLRAESRRFKV